MIYSAFPQIFPKSLILQLLALDLTTPQTVQQYKEAVADNCFVVGCLSKYFAKNLKPSTELDALPEGLDFKQYVEDICNRTSLESTTDVVNDSEASYVFYYFSTVLAQQLVYPEKAVEAVPAEAAPAE